MSKTTIRATRPNRQLGMRNNVNNVLSHHLIIYKEMFLGCDWLIRVQLIPNITQNSAKICNTVQKSVTTVQKLRILQGRVAPEVKSRLYENTEVRYNNALFHIKRSTQLMRGLGSNLCRKIK